ncbi:putative redox protein [Gillisia sp. Hel1_33_143]|uniref:bifunctional alpha/beta hydrolase/OsmC family protein n=1 Tax=Gillisia sp. Hel1_33_143 TaxID=1336796 RepID=UPI00087DA3F2|nr:bifunctional alpha/beta hydrolase/OsmC family protein [Gillisia sp. Hel1_33_143]SDS47283.1 putative redox protein [Gillisia sp. Hel1_33_143]
MSSQNVTFKNKNGHLLKGKLELPSDQEPHNYALFAHCFTCNKNYFAVKNICNALTQQGYGVLRFDFTGLGESEGDFEDSNFSGNVDDLLQAVEFLRLKYKEPSLLIGHSLGGAAVLFAAKELSSVKAVATIAAPSKANHLVHLLKDDLKEINDEGSAEVNIGGRPFKIKKQFLEDIEDKQLKTILPDLDKPLLILHSPQDAIVEIKNAEEIYLAARHPKSFISLDGADHLLTNTRDSIYAGSMIGNWASRYIEISEKIELTTNFEVVAKLGAEGFTTQMQAGNHGFIADEPVKVGGKNLGPSPYDYISAGLAACTSMTIQMYARRKNWIIDSVETHINYAKDYSTDCENCEDTSAKIDTFSREIIIKGDLDKAQLDKIILIADKCPVHKTLTTPTQVITTVIKE